MANVEATVLERRVKLVGRLLNDSDSGVDQLGYVVYAQALAKMLHKCRSPLTVGIFGPWGIGKTFLLKHVQGLLKKYEQQELYDDAPPKVNPNTNLTTTSTTQGFTDDSVSAAMARKKPKNQTRRKNLKRRGLCLFFTVICFLIVTGLVAFFVLLHMPEKGTKKVSTPTSIDIVIQEKSSSVNKNLTGKTNETASGYNTEISGRIPRVFRDQVTSPTVTTRTSRLPTTDDTVVIAGNFKLYLIFILIGFTSLVFAVFCCVSNTNSKCWPRFLQHYSLIFYAAFTRLPSVAVSQSADWLEASNPYMVVHFNDEQAKLRYLEPGDDENTEEACLTSGEINRMPVKYIFVNFQAWQYVGSDKLWAAIVTNLASAIEREFGAVCARLFRMMQVEKLSKSGPIKSGLPRKEDPKAVYVHFNFPDEGSDIALKRNRVLFLMKEYGVVTQCCSRDESWWYVRYHSDKEANFAESALKLNGFNVRRKAPEKSCRKEKSTSSRSSPCEEHDKPSAATPLVHQVVYTPGSNNAEVRVQQPPIKRRSTVSSQYCSGDTSTKTGESACCGSSRSTNSRCFSHFRRHPKTVCCGCPFLYCFIVFVVAAFMFPIVVCIMGNYLELGVLKSTRVIPIEVQIFSWLPGVLGVFIVAMKFCWAMCNSQTERVKKSLAGAEGSMENALGFMNDVKKEVMIMTGLINCIRFTHQVNYKIVITIDDLDRCPYDKVKSVLDAVSILLSDKSSPFLCLIAVDSRVAVKCIEQEIGDVMLQAHVTGHEYLKKIINVPFCLPEVDHHVKKKYFGGVMDESDDTIIAKYDAVDVPDVVVDKPDADLIPHFMQRKDATEPTSDEDQDKQKATASETDRTSTDGRGGARPDDTLNQIDVKTMDELFFNFLFKCREIFYGDTPAGKFIQEHMNGNPRNMKRIFNILSLTTHLMKCIEDQRIQKDFLAIHCENASNKTTDQQKSTCNRQCFEYNEAAAEDLVKWIVATDQWPYRISCILKVIEGNRLKREAGLKIQEISQKRTISHIYETYVEKELSNDQNASSMLSLDHDPMILRAFLRECKSLTVQRVSSFRRVTINLDQSLAYEISHHSVNTTQKTE